MRDLPRGVCLGGVYLGRSTSRRVCLGGLHPAGSTWGGLHPGAVYLGGLPRGGLSRGSASGGSASRGVCIRGIEQNPLPPPIGYYRIRSPSRQYTSYWNAFLLFLCVGKSVGSSGCSGCRTGGLRSRYWSQDPHVLRGFLQHSGSASKTRYLFKSPHL